MKASPKVGLCCGAVGVDPALEAPAVELIAADDDNGGLGRAASSALGHSVVQGNSVLISAGGG